MTQHKPWLALALFPFLLLAGCGGGGSDTRSASTTASPDTSPPSILPYGVTGSDGAVIQISQPENHNLGPQNIPIIGPATTFRVSAIILDDSDLDTTQPPVALIYSRSSAFFASVPLTLSADARQANTWVGERQFQIGSGQPDNTGLKTVIIRAVDKNGNVASLPAGTFFYGTKDGLSTSIPVPLPPLTSVPE